MSTVETRLGEIQDRIRAACSRCDRDPSTVQLLAVSKRQPIERVRQAVAAGHRCFGENQVQEAVAKASQLPSDLEWHMIGPLQSNKVKPAVRLFHSIHSVDREKIARLIDKEAGKLGCRVDVFIQINVGAEPSKHGYGVDGFEAEVRSLGQFPNLRIVGLMAIPPYEENPENSRQWFRKMRKMRDLASEWAGWEDFPGHLSMGMSHDFEVAIEEGATHVRIGTDIFGRRSS